MRLLESGSHEAALTEVGLDDLAAALASGANDLAVRIGGETDFKALAPHASRLAAIVVVFGGFRDGRGFSLGTLLRERANFGGDLRAAGAVIPDHAILLKRCGFASVELPLGASVEDWERSLAAFSAVYQSAADGETPLWSIRAKRAAATPVAAVAAPAPDLQATVDRLNRDLRHASAEEILAGAVAAFPGRIAMLSSFGAEAAAGLHLLSRVDASTPVLFIDTDRHFAQTLTYRHALAAKLGLSNVRVLTPSNAEAVDPKGDLWRTDADLCCAVRRVKPLREVAGDYDALITGRKRFHGGVRMRLKPFELLDGQVRVNPLANWTPGEVEAYFEANGLPRHPLVQGGYASIGCWPCTEPARSADDVRSGRWAGAEKVECGIHMPSRWAAEVEERRAS
jgi:phosphoadenylyl-sulfate reductase (thioredoxin)